MENTILPYKGMKTDGTVDVVIETPVDQKNWLTIEGHVTLAELEKRYIDYLLTYHKGHKAKVARILSVSTKTLYNKIHEYGLFEKYKRDQI